jgi:hypothetical protein
VVDQGTDSPLDGISRGVLSTTTTTLFLLPTSVENIIVRPSPSLVSLLPHIFNWDRRFLRIYLTSQETVVALDTTATNGEIEVTDDHERISE